MLPVEVGNTNLTRSVMRQRMSNLQRSELKIEGQDARPRCLQGWASPPRQICTRPIEPDHGTHHPPHASRRYEEAPPERERDGETLFTSATTPSSCHHRSETKPNFIPNPIITHHQIEAPGSPTPPVVRTTGKGDGSRNLAREEGISAAALVTNNYFIEI